MNDDRPGCTDEPHLHYWQLPTTSDPTYNQPPKPLSCVSGWMSHRWTLHIEEGRLALSTDECRLCDDGISDLEREYLNGELTVRLEFHKEFYGPYGEEIDVWWNVIPAPFDGDDQ